MQNSQSESAGQRATPCDDDRLSCDARGESRGTAHFVRESATSGPGVVGQLRPLLERGADVVGGRAHASVSQEHCGSSWSRAPTLARPARVVVALGTSVSAHLGSTLDCNCNPGLADHEFRGVRRCGRSTVDDRDLRDALDLALPRCASLAPSATRYSEAMKIIEESPNLPRFASLT